MAISWLGNLISDNFALGGM